MSFLEKLKSDYAIVFSGSWPVWVGGLAIGIVNVIMFMGGNPWSTLDGVLNWGDNLGISHDPALGVFERIGSLMNFGLIFGAFLAALLSKQFGVRVGPITELFKGLVGGILIGIGAVLVRGCNIGGFFSGTSAMGMHGLVMALGLTIGAFIGARYLMWEMMRDGPGILPEKVKNINIDLGKFTPEFLKNKNNQPFYGLLIGLIVFGGAIYYYSGKSLLDLVMWIAFGVMLGIISQRSRLCMVHAFREPFITGDASHTKAILLGLIVSVIGFSVVKADVFAGREGDFVRATFWQGSLIGGIIFGFGMVLAGGCGGGMMWRVGEGHVKLWVALLAYIVSASMFDDFLMNTMITNADGKEVNLFSQLGQEMFLPDVVGWSWALLIVFGIIIAWYLLVQWNEISHRFAAM